MPSPAEAAADEIITLFQTNGAAPYEGGSISQAAHSVQCAMLAMEALSDLPLIIGALLHDIGHLLKAEAADTAGPGAAYLRHKGFSERVCAIAAQHAAGRRYLLAMDKLYWSKLSAISLRELHAHGGALSAEEATAFERQPYFMDIIRVCQWDAAAKKAQDSLLPLSFFRRLLWDHLSRVTV
jgi:predicted HD phosphohydrolase